MRIAVYHDLPSGGAKRALYEMLKRLSEKHLVEVFSYRENEKYMSLETLDVPIHWLEKPKKLLVDRKRHLVFNDDLRAYEVHQKQVAKMIDAAQFDVVFVHASSFTQSPSVLHYLETPSVYYSQEVRRVWYEKNMRDSVLSGGAKAMVNRRRQAKIAHLDARNIAGASMLLVNSYYSAEAHKIAHGINGRVVYLGIDSKKFKSSTRKIKANSTKILVVGGLETFKHQDLVVRSAALVGSAKGHPNVHCIYDRCNEKYLRDLKRLAARLKVPLTLQRGISDKELVAQYKAADVVVCAADLEPFGFTPLESIACGTPVASIREGGYRETVVDGKNGYFANERSPRGLADAIKKSLSLKPSNKYFYDYVKNTWDWEHTIQGVETAFKEVTSQ